MVLIDADMIVTALARRADRRGRRRAGSSRSRTTASGSSPSGASCSTSAPTRRRPLRLLGPRLLRRRDRRRGARAARRPPAPGRHRADAVRRATSPTIRSSIPSRTCSTRSSAPAIEPDRIVALANRLAPNPPFAGLRLTDARRRALRLRRRRRALRPPPLPSQALARADVPRALLTAARAACCSAPDVALRLAAEPGAAADAPRRDRAGRARPGRRRRRLPPLRPRTEAERGPERARGGLLLRHRPGLLPRRGRDAQLAAPARAHRAAATCSTAG